MPPPDNPFTSITLTRFTFQVDLLLFPLNREFSIPLQKTELCKLIFNINTYLWKVLIDICINKISQTVTCLLHHNGEYKIFKAWFH